MAESIKGTSEALLCLKADQNRILNTVTLVNGGSEESEKIDLSRILKNPLSDDAKS